MLIWSGRTEWNCHHEFPGLGCLRYTTPRNESGAPGETRTHNPCLRGRCLDPIWLLTHGGTERTRTVIDLIDNQVPHLSATVPKIADFQSARLEQSGSSRIEPISIENRKSKMIWVGRRDSNPHGPQSQCGALPIE